MNTSKIMKSKFRGYCSRCHYTIWKGEVIEYDGNANHYNCSVALKDETPRILHPRYFELFGKVDKVKLATQLKSSRGTKQINLEARSK